MLVSQNMLVPASIQQSFSMPEGGTIASEIGLAAKGQNKRRVAF